MTNQHPITPPPELVSDWDRAHMLARDTDTYVFTQAARWGADQELEACCEWLTTAAMSKPWETVAQLANELRIARRPKPLSLKEYALGLLNEGPVSALLDGEVEIIRRALKQLPDTSDS